MVGLVAALALVATLAGVGVGFVWWGLPLQRLRDAQAELGRERELRARLDAIAGHGPR